MATWTNIWVIGPLQAMTAFLSAKKISDSDGGTVLPHGIFVTNPIYPQVVDGVDEFGNTTYKRKTGTQPVLWCFSLTDSEVSLIGELKLLNNPNYAVIENSTLDEVKALCPEYALGQGIPHIASIK